VNEAFGILETTGWTPAMVALDAMQKSATIRVLQAELNDFLGTCIKILGSIDDVRTAVAAGKEVAAALGGKPVAHVINRPDDRAWTAIESRAEHNPLIQQDVVHVPRSVDRSGAAGRDDEQRQSTPYDEETFVADQPTFALGFIETQGFTAVFEAIDSACKAANVEVLGKEKLGGGYVTVVVKGDVAAVKAAIDAGKSKVEGLGKLIAAHVIARPSSSVLALLPK
jgi:microcompartment protein CcmL/EutN